MATRKIIRIDEDLCNGCGDCVTGCAEGALQIIDGKARLVREDFCDGFGDCIGACPTGALTIEEREAETYDLEATRRHVAASRGQSGIEALDAASQWHHNIGVTDGELPEDIEKKREPGCAPGVDSATRVVAGPIKQVSHSSGGCPGSQMRVLPRADDRFLPPIPRLLPGTEEDPSFSAPQVLRPELGQWPVQLHLINPAAPFLKNRELAILSTCSPVAMPDVNWRFVRDRSVAIACPKLDRTEGYVEKLTAILAEPSIPRAIVVRMEVPCCRGLTGMVERAAEATGRDDLEVLEITVGIRGEVQHTERIWPV